MSATSNMTVKETTAFLAKQQTQNWPGSSSIHPAVIVLDENGARIMNKRRKMRATKQANHEKNVIGRAAANSAADKSEGKNPRPRPQARY